MTTCAYRDGIIAADTLTTGGNHRIGHTVKVGGRAGVLWSASGDAAWCKLFRDWARRGLPADGPPAIPDENTGGFFVLPDDTVLVCHIKGFELRRGLPFWADGSGADYALGAMQAGATAEEAVRAAMVWDTSTGGDVTVLKREKPHA